MENHFNELRKTYDKALDESFELSNKTFPGISVNTFDKQVDDILQHIKARLNSLKQMIEELRLETSVKDATTDCRSTIVKCVDIYGNNYTQKIGNRLPHNIIYINKYSEER